MPSIVETVETDFTRDSMDNYLKLVTGLAICVLLGWVGSNDADAQENQALVPQKHMELFKKYCFDCHDAGTMEGKLNLEAIPFNISKDIPTAESWSDILAAVNAGEMPPEDSEQISNAEKTEFLKNLSIQMVKARNILSDSGGEITMRRLNRREYQNTLEALFGFQPDVSTLPNDDDNGGFDTSGASLFFSSDQFEQYRSTAKQAMAHAISRNRRPKPKTVRLEGETISEEAVKISQDKLDVYKNAEAFLAQDEKPATEFGFRDAAQAKKQFERTTPDRNQLKAYFLDRPESKTGTVLLPYRIKGLSTFRLKPSYSGGTYKVRIRAACYDDAPERQRYLNVAFNAGKQEFELEGGSVKVTGTLTNPQLIELEVEHPNADWGVFSVAQRNYDKASRYYIHQLYKSENGVGKPPAIWVDYVEIEGPFFEDYKSDALDALLQLKRTPLKKGQAESLIQRFATIAFRDKTPSAEFVTKIADFYLAKCEKGDDAKEAMIDCFALVLSSPSFLYLSEPRAGETPARLNDRELAIRLSYFLWSAPPDQQLMAAAKKGRLSNPEVLKSETQRLLSDPRSNEFISGFTHQWLDMKRIDMFDFSAKYHPEFDETLRSHARREVFETIRHSIDNELPVETLLKSDFVIVNELLADFYGLNGPQKKETLTSNRRNSKATEKVVGSEFRKVSLPKGSPRGGLLGMAAIHIMGSDGQRSSPVERGAWVLRHLLNDPPPPAPANIPMLEHEDKVMSIRDLQIRHQTEPQCAQCHQKIDPIGYGMENFAASGLWRDVENVEVVNTKNKKKKGPPKYKMFEINPAGELPGGQKFGDFLELRDAIQKDYSDTFARGLTENLIAYGLGRPYGISDYNLATAIKSEASKDGSSISALIHALVQSEAFSSK